MQWPTEWIPNRRLSMKRTMFRVSMMGSTQAKVAWYAVRAFFDGVPYGLDPRAQFWRDLRSAIAVVHRCVRQEEAECHALAPSQLPVILVSLCEDVERDMARFVIYTHIAKSS